METTDRIHEVERQLVAHLIEHPKDVEAAKKVIDPESLKHPLSRGIYRAFVAHPTLPLSSNMRTVDMREMAPIVKDLGRLPADIEQILADIAIMIDDRTVIETTIASFASSLRSVQLQTLAIGPLSALGANLADDDAFDDFVRLRNDLITQRDSGDPENNILIKHVIDDEFDWEMIDEYVTPDAIVPGLIYPRTVSVLAGDPFVGKSAFMLHIAMCLGRGEPPWDGCGNPAKQNVLYISYDELLPQLARRMDQLAMTLPGGFYAGRTHRFGVGGDDGVMLFGVSPETPPSVLERYRLPDGAAHLDHDLAVMKKSGRNIGGIVIDTMSRAMRNLKEDVAADMTLLVDELASVAMRNDVWIVMLHHLRKGSREDGDPFDRVRGSGAILGCVRAAGLLMRGGDDNTRILKCRTNLGPEPGVTLLKVADDNEPGKIVYWRSMSGDGEEYPVKYFQGSEELTQPVLICRMLNLPEDTKMKDVSGDKRTAKRGVIGKWESRGWVRLSDDSTANRKSWVITQRGRSAHGDDMVAEEEKPATREVDVNAMFGAQHVRTNEGSGVERAMDDDEDIL